MNTNAPRGGSLLALKEWNRNRILALLQEHGSLSQAELSRLTGLSQGTISTAIAALVRVGTVSTRAGIRNGRRASLVELTSAGSPPVLGIDIARGHFAIGAVQLDGSLLAFHIEPRSQEETYEAELSRCAQAVDTLLEDLQMRREEFEGVGVGLCVGLHPKDNRIPRLPSLNSFSLNDSWADADVGADLSARLDMPVVALNDADCGVLAEGEWGAAATAGNAIFVQLGDGIGGGLLIGGKLHRGGPAGAAGELGHLSHDPSGKLCACGNRGCLETVAGGAALVAEVGDLAGPNLSVRRLAELARDGNPACRRVIVDAAHPIGVVLWSAISVLAPEVVVLGGDLACAGSVLKDNIASAVSGIGSADVWSGEVRLGTLSERTVVMGAALGLHHAMSSKL